MTGKQKMLAALSKDGSPQTPAVICYDSIYYRDHWSEVTSSPWWHREDPDLAHQVAWMSQAIERTGQDWLEVRAWHSRQERQGLRIDHDADGVYLTDVSTGRRRKLCKLQPGTHGGAPVAMQPGQFTGPRNEADLDAAVPIEEAFDRQEFLASGRGDLAAELIRRFGQGLLAFQHVAAPLQSCSHLWGFEGLMLRMCDQPDLVQRARERLLHNRVVQIRTAAAMGVQAIWIEDCFTDSVSPRQFAELNVPTLRQLVEEVRAARMHSIYYYTGDPNDRWELLMEVGADALALEEGKKGFAIDIQYVVDRVRGRCAVLGNLDALHLLEQGTTDELRAEIARQIEAGRRNGGRFIMSLGSPPAPQTPAAKVRLYCDLVHQISE